MKFANLVIVIILIVHLNTGQVLTFKDAQLKEYNNIYKICGLDEPGMICLGCCPEIASIPMSNVSYIENK